MSAVPNVTVSRDTGRLPVTLPSLAEKKRLGEPIVMVTAYDFPSAQVAEAAGVDMVLVGDSGAMTVLGYDSTVPVSVDELLMLCSATRRGLKTPFLVADLPFGSYEGSDEQAVSTAQRFVKEGGAAAVKLEGGGTMVDRARAIVAAGIPVMGHVGLTPQTATALGGYKAQGRTGDRALSVAADALALQEAGCFSIVFEAIPAAVGTALNRAHGDPGDRDRRRSRHRRPGPGLPRPARDLRRDEPALRQALRPPEGRHGRRGLRLRRRCARGQLPRARARLLDRPRGARGVRSGGCAPIVARHGSTRDDLRST